MKYFNYILILFGAFVAIYSKSGVEQNQYVLIAGIIVLMVGIYRVSKSIPSKVDNSEDEFTEN